MADPATEATPKATLYTLPAEMHLEIFSYLHPVYSTCLGLTCKKFYPIHRDMNGKVPLTHSHPIGRLTELQLEVQLVILSYLQPEFLTRLRGTSKKFYGTYDYLNGTIPFKPFTYMAEWAGKAYVPDQLWHLLHNWMGPGLFWSFWNSKFITEKKFREEEKEREGILYRY